MNIHWTNSTGSGLGDRLIDIGLMLAYSHVKGGKLYFDWVTWEPHPGTAPHRAQDSLFTNVREHIIFPPDVVVGRPTFPTIPFHDYLGGGITPEAFCTKYLAELSVSHFKMILNKTYQEFRFCRKIMDYLDTLPEKYVAFHIRRFDKLRKDGGDNYYVMPLDDLDELNVATEKIMDRELPDYEHVFLCGDDDTATARFAEYVKQAGKNLIVLPDMEKWRTSYYDLAVMSRADKVIVSHCYSSFSRFAAAVGGKPYVPFYKYTGIGYTRMICPAQNL